MHKISCNSKLISMKENMVNFDELSEEEKESLKKEIFEIFIELKKKGHGKVRSKDISKEVLNRFNVLISPKKITYMKQKEGWEKKFQLMIGMGVMDGMRLSIMDPDRSRIDIRNYEKQLLNDVKVFFKKRFTELQFIADKLFVALKENDIYDKNYWKHLVNFLNVHQNQLEMLKVIGVDKIIGEQILSEEGTIDMNKILRYGSLHRRMLI